MAKSYKQLKDRLQEVIGQLEDESIDIDKALVLHREATELVKELENYLKKTELRFESVNKKK